MVLNSLVCSFTLLSLVRATEVWYEAPTSLEPTSKIIAVKDRIEIPGSRRSELMDRKLVKRFLGDVVDNLSDAAKQAGQIKIDEKSCSERATQCIQVMEDTKKTGANDPSTVCKHYNEAVKCQQDVYDNCPDLEKPSVSVIMKSFEDSHRGICAASAIHYVSLVQITTMLLIVGFINV